MIFKFFKRKRLGKNPTQENVRDYVERFNLKKIKERDKKRGEKNESA